MRLASIAQSGARASSSSARRAAAHAVEVRLPSGAVRPLAPGDSSLILKGIIDPEDAKIAMKCGVDAIVVSNHGGRQLDGAISSIRALPEIVEAVQRGTEVWVDGGIRSGQDVLKALALGARATMIGRAFLYGLGALGEAGVTRALEIIRNELDVSMALCGIRNVKDASPALLRAW